MSAWTKFRNKVTKPFKQVGSFVAETWKDAGKILDQYVVKPIEKDPWGFIITAAASSFGIPFIVGPGAIASGLATTAVNLAQGKDFNDAIKAGVTAGALDFGLSEGMNALSKTPKPYGSSLGSVNNAPLAQSIFSDSASNAAVEAASNNFKNTLSLDDAFGSSGDDITSALKNDQIGALTDPMTPYNSSDLYNMSEGAGGFSDDVYNKNQIETYLNDDGMLAFDKGEYAAYAEPAPRSYSVSDAFPNKTADVINNVPDSASFMDAGTGLDAVDEYFKPQSNAVKKSADLDWWKSPIESLGKYSEDKIGIDVTSPWVVGAGVLGSNYYSGKKADEEEKRRREEAAKNDPANNPLFTTRLQQYRMDRNKNRYTGDPSRYAERRNTNSGEFGFYDPAVYTPIEAATGGQIRNPHAYYQYGNVPESVREYAHGGLSALSDGRSDDIPAVLSDGEYVMDAETVALLGNGSTDAGAKQLDRMRESLRKQKGKALSKGKFSPNAKSPLAYLQKRG